jgi:MoaA/NifB/PqqE/SkfB family radical SAM enzyme
MLVRQLKNGRVGWMFGVASQYLRIAASPVLGRPLGGPILGTLLTNYDCNLHCRMCRLPALGGRLGPRRREPMGTDAMRSVIDGFADLGVRGIGFTGGEPLLRPDIFQLLSHTARRGMLTHLNSNGTLIDDRTAAAILEAGVDSLNISLDSATEAVHDRIRGKSGAFGKTVEAIRRIDRLRKETRSPLRMKIVGVLSDDNLEEVPDYLRLGASLGVDCVEFIPCQPFPEGPLARPKAGPETLAKLEEAIRYLSGGDALPVPLENSPGMLALFAPSFRGEPSPVKCLAGYNSLAVDCYGRVFPCVPYINWDRPAGELSGRSLREFWHSEEYSRVRRETARCRACTLNCQAELNLLFDPFFRMRSAPRPEGTGA